MAHAIIAGLLTLALAAAILLLPGTAAFWVVAGAGLVALVLLEPFSALLLLPFAVAFGSLASLSVLGVNIGPTDLLVGGLSVAWLARHFSRLPHAPSLLAVGRLRALWVVERERSLLFLALAGYLLVVCASLVVASDRVATVKEIIKWSEVLVVVALSATYLRSEWRVRALVWAILGASVAEAILGYIQWVAATGAAGPGGESLRVFGTFDQPNPYAGFLNFGLLLALALALFGRDARERWLAGGVGALLLVALALAGSRGAALGLVVALVAMLVVRWRRERMAVLIVLCSVPLLLVGWLTRIIPAGVQQALLAQARMGEVNNANFSTVERIAHWIAGARMFLAHPILGVGAGNYDAAYQRYALPEWPDPLGHAHNYYINTAAETGALGCLMFLALTAATFYLGWRAAQRLREAPLSRGASLALALGMMAALVALATHNLTDDLFVHAIELQFALTLGGLLALFRIGAMSESSASESSAPESSAPESSAPESSA